jgi:hypothetical protein
MFLKGYENMANTITAVLKRKKLYDGKDLWEYYHSLGKAATHGKLREYAKTRGMYSHRKGVPSQMGPYWAMWRYALRNPEEAWPAYEKWAKEYEGELIAQGIDINFQNFLEDIREHAKSGGVVGDETYLEFCEKYQLNPNPQKVKV